MPKILPIGTEDFAKLRERYYFVDKSGFIAEFLHNHNDVTLITRPRRFGKTLLLSMMQHFLDVRDAETNRQLFEGLKVANDAQAMAEQGKRPVVFLTMKNMEWDTWEGMQKKISWEFMRLYSPFKYLLQDEMNTGMRAAFESILANTPTLETLSNAFQMLCLLLEAHHGQRVVLLIDEYDAPIQCAWSHGYYQDAIGFFRTLYSSALKTNASLDFAILTGVLRIAKESIFSGLNNLDVSSVISGGYADACGYTQAEIRQMAHDFGREDKLAELAAWYDGYQFQGTDIYNPWSVNNYFKQGCKPRKYWVKTSGNSILQVMLRHLDARRTRQLNALMAGKTISTQLEDSFIYADIEQNRANLYALLLSTGYLKCVDNSETGDEDSYVVSIPNGEIRRLYRDEILKYLSTSSDRTVLDDMLTAMQTGDIEDFQDCLQTILRNWVSYHDAAQPESFYHGLMLGLTVWLEKCYRIASNKESGYGRFDLAFFPKQDNLPGIIMEFKAVKTEDELPAAVDAACQQIQQKAYLTDLQAAGTRPIWCYGIAFCKKYVQIQMCP
jgi:hypothetical protein